MDNGSLNPNDVATLSLLGGGYGYGRGWGGGYIGEPAFGPASNGVRINRNLDCTKEQSDCTRMAMGLNLDRISDQNLETRSILRNSSIAERFNTLEREMNANAREAAKCCCDTQKEILQNRAEFNLRFAENAKQQCEDKAQILAAIKDSESRAVERQLNAANAELTALKTQIACGCCTPRTT